MLSKFIVDFIFKLPAMIVVCCLALTSCHNNSKNHLYKKLSKEDIGNNHYQGHYKVGNKYKVKNISYKPAARKHYNQTGMARSMVFMARKQLMVINIIKML